MKLLASACIVSFVAISAVTQNNPIPFVSQPLTPTSVVPGHAAFTLRVKGAGFRSGAVVNWNGSSRPTKLVSPNEVDAAISATDVAEKTIATVMVSNLSPGGGKSNFAYFSVGPAFGEVAFARRDTVINPPIKNPEAFPMDPVVADFNNDGKLDLAVGWTDGKRGIIQVFLGNGDGTLQPPVETEVHFPIASLLAGDFNGDGNEDIALARTSIFESAYVHVLLGTGDGHFKLVTAGGTIDGEPIVAADFNGDGKLDLIVSTFNDGTTTQYVALGYGDGTFASPTRLEDLEFFSVPAVGDFNDDGILDIALTACFYNCSGGAVDVFWGNGDGTFQLPARFQTQTRTIGVAAGDVNRDGNLDIVTGATDVLLGNGKGGFTAQAGDGADAGLGLQLLDLNNDHKLDLFSSSYGTFAAFLGNGDGTFRAPQTWDSGSVGTSGAVVGFPQDGRLAIVDLNTNALSDAWVISTFRQTTLSVSPTFFDFGNKAVGFSSPPQNFTVTNIGGWPVTIGAIQLSGHPQSYSENNNCVGTLAAGASCTITVTFLAQLPGHFPLEVGIYYGGTTGSPQYIEIAGSAVL
jgi:hypothetical protein